LKTLQTVQNLKTLKLCPSKFVFSSFAPNCHYTSSAVQVSVVSVGSLADAASRTPRLVLTDGVRPTPTHPLPVHVASQRSARQSTLQSRRWCRHCQTQWPASQTYSLTRSICLLRSTLHGVSL